MIKLEIILIVIFSLTIIALGCNNENKRDDSEIPIFNIKEVSKITNLKLSDLNAVDIQYIPLETTEQSLFSINNKLIAINPIKIVVGDGFYLVNYYNTIFKFLEDGSFDLKIGKAGRGPGEFSVVHDLDFNIKDRNIYVVSGWQKKFNVYSEEGKFIRSFGIPLYALVNFRFTDNNILCYSENHLGTIENSYTLIDTNGKDIKNYPNKYPFVNRNSFIFQHENIFYRYQNQLFKKEVYSDTVYVFDKLDFSSHLVIQAGDKLITPDARSSENEMDISEKYIQPLNILEFGDFVYYDFVYRFVSNEKPTIISIIGSKVNGFQALFNKSDGILNDLDGGPGIIPWTVKDDNTILSLVDALMLKNYVASEKFKNSNPKYPEKKKELERLASNLKETDNPVLVLVKLRE